MKKILIIILIILSFVRENDIKLYCNKESSASFDNWLITSSEYSYPTTRLNNFRMVSNTDLNLTGGMFLVASPNIIEPIFSKSVILLIEYDRTGAMGFIINKPSNIKLKNLLLNTKGLFFRNKTIFFGGPVSINSLFAVTLSKNLINNPEAIKIFDNVYLISRFKSIETLLSKKEIRKQLRIFAGYAGWAPGQLEYEILRGDWYIIPADIDNIFFKDTKDIWPDLVKKSSFKLVVKLNNFYCYKYV